MRKNDIVTVKIEDIGVGGEGIGKADGYAIFVKDAIVDDVVRAVITKAKKNYGYGRLLEILEPSPDRVPPPCPVARQCGGCQILEMSYDRQLQLKKQKVESDLARIGGLTDCPVRDTIGCQSPFRYRNKSQFPVGRDKSGRIIAGFYAGRTHCIIQCPDCRIGIEENRPILDILLRHMEKYNISPYDEKSHSGLVRHVLIRKGFRTGEIMVSIIINGDHIPAQESLVSELISRIPGLRDISLNINRGRTNKILGRELVQLAGDGYITDYIGDIQFRISPLSFYQVNPQQTEVLYREVLTYAALTGRETVFDLYCGVGTISLFLARSAGKVYGVESVPEAVEDARVNAALNDIQNVEFLAGRAEEIIPAMYEDEGVSADVVVLDPPRKGCDEKLLETIIRMAPARVVYVSCNPATLARDLKYLTANGYGVEVVQPLDMFAGSVHVETVVLLSRENK